MLSPDTSSSTQVAVGAASVQFSSTLASGQVWLFVSNANCWIAQGANPTASAGAGSMYVPANVVISIWGNGGAKVAVIQDGASTGKASLTRTNVL